MLNRAKTAVAVMGCAAMLSSTAAQAQQDCVTEREVASMMIYAVPEVIGAAQTKCAGELSENGFLATEGDALKQRYAVLQDEMWPQAKNALIKFGQRSGSSSRMTGMIADLPDDAIRPFVDAIVLQMIAKEVKPKHCRNIERGFSLVSKFDPRDTGALIGFVIGMSGVKNPRVCPYEGE